MSASGTVQARQFFRIGTGGTAGTYYPVGGMIANAVSQPGKIVVTAQASNGSLATVTGIAGGALASGFNQANVASWANTGKGVFEGKRAIAGLRLIANLYPERVLSTARKGAGIKTVADLKGKRVALDEPVSGTLIKVTKALFAEAGQKATGAGHAKCKFITKENAIKGAGVLLHSGAETHYKEAGLL